MFRLVGMESQTINQKMKCLMFIAVIQFLLGKQCYMKVHIYYWHVDMRSINMIFYVITFLTLFLTLLSCLLACGTMPLNI